MVSYLISWASDTRLSNKDFDKKSTTGRSLRDEWKMTAQAAQELMQQVCDVEDAMHEQQLALKQAHAIDKPDKPEEEEMTDAEKFEAWYRKMYQGIPISGDCRPEHACLSDNPIKLRKLYEHYNKRYLQSLKTREKMQPSLFFAAASANALRNHITELRKVYEGNPGAIAKLSAKRPKHIMADWNCLETTLLNGMQCFGMDKGLATAFGIS
jgi:hypothetical protein